MQRALRASSGRPPPAGSVQRCPLVSPPLALAVSVISQDSSGPLGDTSRTFEFGRDTFAFRNELVWEYRVDGQAVRMSTRRAEPAPAFAHRCFVMVRAVRQFLFHARFEPELPRPQEDGCFQLARAVLRRSPRCPSGPGAGVRIPGFRGLRELSATYEALVKRVVGPAWQSYVLRSHWRIVFPFTRRHQAREAGSLLAGLSAGRFPIVHVVRFPQLTINHGLLLFSAEPAGEAVKFMAYDPNTPQAPTRLSYRPDQRTFFLPPSRYWAGGRVDVFEIYHGWF